jgi:hypothetical protein
MKKLLASLFLSSLFAFSLNAQSERLYVDEKECEFDQCVSIHLGGNEWICANALHSDETGVYVYESDILMDGKEYVKKWKCPYCHFMWAEGERCQNPKCPSKY